MNKNYPRKYINTKFYHVCCIFKAVYICYPKYVINHLYMYVYDSFLHTFMFKESVQPKLMAAGETFNLTYILFAC